MVNFGDVRPVTDLLLWNNFRPRRTSLHISFRAAPSDEQHREFTTLLRRLPGEGTISDLLGAYGTDQVFFTFPPERTGLPEDCQEISLGGCNTRG